MKRTSRKPSKLSESVHQQLTMYALAAGAAGVSVLALAQPAEAKVIYTSTNVVIHKKYHYDLDLNHDGIKDFSIWNYYSGDVSGCHFRDRVDWETRSMGNGVMSSVRSSYAAALPKGQVISRSKHFEEIEGLLALVDVSPRFCRLYHAGNWYNVKNLYLGLKFQINGKTHFGWARLNVVLEYNSRELLTTLTGYAYETIPGKAIIAGKTKGPDVITLQDPSLGHLAAGASAIPAWRHKEQ